MWREASQVQLQQTNLDWKKFPWQAAIVHFTRLMGAVHLKEQHTANTRLSTLKELKAELIAQKDNYKTNQVDIQIKTGEAWMKLMDGNQEAALAMMQAAADLEDKTGKHPVTPGEVLPARELLGDMLMEMHKYEAALAAYDSVLVNAPNRFNSLYGAGRAAQKMGNTAKATKYYKQLLSITGNNKERPELMEINKYLEKNSLDQHKQ